jgi:hypothetical protein
MSITLGTQATSVIVSEGNATIISFRRKSTISFQCTHSKQVIVLECSDGSSVINVAPGFRPRVGNWEALGCVQNSSRLFIGHQLSH